MRLDLLFVSWTMVCVVTGLRRTLFFALACLLAMDTSRLSLALCSSGPAARKMPAGSPTGSGSHSK